MKRFLIQTSVENAEGSQTWYVDAESEAQALEKYKAGEADIYASEVDVTSLGAPEWAGETTLDDFGDFGPATPPTQCNCSQRTAAEGDDSKVWVGLTDEEFQLIYDMGRTPAGMMEMVEAKLKEKNT